MGPKVTEGEGGLTESEKLSPYPTDKHYFNSACTQTGRKYG